MESATKNFFVFCLMKPDEILKEIKDLNKKLQREREISAAKDEIIAELEKELLEVKEENAQLNQLVDEADAELDMELEYLKRLDG